LALSSIGMGGFLAYFYDIFSWMIFLLACSTTVFLQILSNLANDYGDYSNGADNENRKGPDRAVQKGLISPQKMKGAIAVFVLLSLVSGISLLAVSVLSMKEYLMLFGLGILCIVAAIRYTAGKNPYGYAGLGDISVFLFFGLVGVLGSFYLYSGELHLLLLLPALSCGAFSAAVLNINNMRDIESDAPAGKITIPVRLGAEKAKGYHFFLLFLGIFCAFLFVFFAYVSIIQYLFLLSLPFFIYNGMKVWKLRSYQLDPYLKQMALSTLLFVVLFGLGLVFAK
jgi:1,4-dihydroxy-2-naphthoate polyprenyltransferase